MDVVMPQLGETVTEGTVTAWRKRVGDAVKADEPLFDVGTAKVETEIPAPASGTLREILVPEGETVVVGARLAVIEEADRKRPAGRAKAKLSPVVRRLLAEHGIDAGAVTGSGDGGRITRRDVLAHIAQREGPGSIPRGDQTDAAPPTDREVIPFNRLRKMTAEHMVRSKATSAHSFQAIDVDFRRIEDVRAARREAWARQEGTSLTALPFVARALCLAIADFPRVNASVEAENLILHRHVNLAIAVDLDHEGLVAPVISDAATMPVPALARAIRDLVAKARGGALGADDVAGGTYTLSNAGAFGTLFTVPIINQPQVAILSFDAVRKRAIVVTDGDEDRIVVRPTAVLAQSFDHRAIDGAYSAAFLARVGEIVEGRDWDAEFA
ncbi:MAG: dihydrolipoamide acetyltransferase family protein [Rhodospirillales bacterium]|jgi:2-oxoglutarate dehydrogenase E2 component (dihydrolipoamide succinyltransferase)|nr:dihydrolipoamide acetyltransferase family protein [Rhodospirillales bacterium]